MGSLDPKYAGLCEKSVIFDDGGYQIRNFNIILYTFFNWCYQEYPTYDNCNCTIGNPMSYLDVLMHEMGHAVGLLDIYQVCLDSDWSSCQYDIDEIPTMTSLSPDCEQYNIYSNGWACPFFLANTLSVSDLYAIYSLYYGQTVENIRYWDMIELKDYALNIHLSDYWRNLGQVSLIQYSGRCEISNGSHIPYDKLTSVAKGFFPSLDSTIKCNRQVDSALES